MIWKLYPQNMQKRLLEIFGWVHNLLLFLAGTHEEGVMAILDTSSIHLLHLYP